MARIALVVPHIVAHGGVVSVARFVLRTLREQGGHDVRVISLAMSSRDAASALIRRPSTWLTGPRAQDHDADGQALMFEGQPYTHVGARFGEIETRRYARRGVLDRAVGDCDMIQIVAGSPAWAAPFLHLPAALSLQVATLTAIERRQRMETWRGPTAPYRRWITNRVSAIETRALRALDAVQVENQWMFDHVRRINTDPALDLRFAVPGVDETLFHPAEHRPALPGTLISVGRMSDPRKNHRLLIDAYHRACQRISDAPRLCLVGPDHPSEALTAQIAALGLTERIDIHHRPDIEALAALYRGAAGFVLASDEEGFGVTVIEAMASGIPVISTRSGGPDHIITDGQDGFLVNRDDADAMADRIVRLIEDRTLNDDLGRAGRATVLDRYAEGPAGEAFLDTADRLLSRNTRRRDHSGARP